MVCLRNICINILHKGDDDDDNKLIYKYKTYITGEITLHVAQIINTEQLQHYVHYKQVCFRYITVNTLHKGDKKDDDDDDDDGNNNNNNNNNYYYYPYEYIKLQVTDKYYEEIPGRFINVNSTTIMWDVPVTTDLDLPAD